MTEKQYSKVVLTTKNKKITLRFLKKDDVDRLLNFINELADEDTFITINKKLVMKEEEKYVKKKIRARKEKNGFNVVALYGEKIIANGGVGRKGERQEHVGELDLSVSQKFRNESLGSIIMKELIILSKDFLKLRILCLRVFGNNQRAIHVYQKMGFKKCGQIPKALFYKDKYEEEVIMFKEL